MADLIKQKKRINEPDGWVFEILESEEKKKRKEKEK